MKESFVTKITEWASRQWKYCSSEVWNDPRHNWKVNTVKTLNLTARSFMNADLQSKASALTYSTLLAIVPVLALICAIGRGFGLQDVLMEQLIKHIPSQATLLKTAFGFVDSYLSEASGGVFVGVGVVFLLWTMISLIRSIEVVFNEIWQVPRGRSIWRMVTDYLAIVLVLPILLICASGISIFMSSSLTTLLPYGFMQPAIEALFDLLGVVLSWLFFAGTYMLVPNTKVKFRSAIIPGIIVGTAVQILQWLFISGQLYVAKYNAIYGSFSFLPLFLIWMQLVWLFTLSGGVLCYAIQNMGEYNYGDNIQNISDRYRMATTLVVMTIIAQRFHRGEPPLTLRQIALDYRLPINLITPEVDRLKRVGLVNFIDSPGKEMNERPVQPAIEVSGLTVAQVVERLHNYGCSDFIPDFSKAYASIERINQQLIDVVNKEADKVTLISINLNNTEQ